MCLSPAWLLSDIMMIWLFGSEQNCRYGVDAGGMRVLLTLSVISATSSLCSQLGNMLVKVSGSRPAWIRYDFCGFVSFFPAGGKSSENLNITGTTTTLTTLGWTAQYVFFLLLGVSQKKRLPTSSHTLWLSPLSCRDRRPNQRHHHLEYNCRFLWV